MLSFHRAGPYLLTAALLVAAAGAEEPLRHTGRAFLFSVDVDAARLEGWVASEAGEAAVLEAARLAVERRVDSVAKFVEARVALEPERTISITFVGAQSPGYEKMVIDGLSNPGRIELYEQATAANIEGPDGLIVWKRSRLDEPSTGDVAVVAASRVRLDGDRLESAEAVRTAAGPTLQLGLTLQGREATAELLSSAAAALAIVVNDEVAWVGPVKRLQDETIVLEAVYSMDELRALIWALAGGPLPAPLTYSGVEARPLPAVRDGSLK